ncbi:DUF4012 domain-containing protein [uncultured Nocardioides sp.]|uniref:DUF4012 domain-containing protein n=1 Tax=uncultured Nocardioides sp. TaxID=198441 RepID=UPI0026295F68|nr:DUF4012 domain-containing protein [uncultured Nocardioides sp.]
MVLSLLVLVLLWLAYTAWLVWRVERDLTTARASAESLSSAVRAEDGSGAERALAQLQLSSATADGHTRGTGWSVLTRLPVVGDDADGVRATSSSLVSLAGGVEPLVRQVSELGPLSHSGRIDLDQVIELQQPVATASAAVGQARGQVRGLDTSSYAGPLRTAVESYVDDLDTLDGLLSGAATATRALPALLGADGHRTYLLVVQNNAEIRATGGLPGAWAELSVDDGAVRVRGQGTASDFPVRPTSAAALADGEQAVYSDLYGRYFQDATFTPDFTRAAALMRAHWEGDQHDKLDGVVSIDPVALSYVLAAIGPVGVEGTTLTSDNAVPQLLQRPYLDRDPASQDAFFAAATRAVVGALTGDQASPTELVRALARAVDEHRLYVAPFADELATELQDSAVLGAVDGDDGDHPNVLVALNDATGSKMSYYLRHRVSVHAEGCAEDRQDLRGTLTLSQTLTAEEASKLPVSVTGSGDHGVPLGSQLVAVRLYGPTGGSLSDVTVAGAAVPAQIQQLAGRPVATVAALVTGPDEVQVTWSMTGAPGARGAGAVRVTPGIEAGSLDSTFASGSTSPPTRPPTRAACSATPSGSPKDSPPRRPGR